MNNETFRPGPRLIQHLKRYLHTALNLITGTYTLFGLEFLPKETHRLIARNNQHNYSNIALNTTERSNITEVFKCFKITTLFSSLQCLY